MENNNSSFLDKNTILAIGLSIVFFVGWQFYVQKKYPQPEKDKAALAQATDKKAETGEATSNVATTEQKEVVDKTVENIVINQEEQQATFSSEKFDATISSFGMGFKDVSLKTYSDRDNKPIAFGPIEKNKYNFATLYKNKPILFSINKKDETTFVGQGHTEDFTIVKTIEIDESKYNANVSLEVKWITDNRSEPIETVLGDKTVEVSSSMFMPAYEGTEFFVINEGSEERERIDNEKKMSGQYLKATLASVGSQYFTLALLDESDVIPSTNVNYNPATKMAVLSVFHKAIDNKEVFKSAYLAYMGPKKYDVLMSIDQNLAQTINYGIFSILSKPMLTLLKWLNGIFSNWGVAIILLTIFIRILLLPINISSFRSMKKMQKIQPRLKAIKEKYKDDPQRVNQETMALMKKEKANPLGGCLPMLLQLPVFFALYSVLGQSVELYKSPFVFWIQDLSYKDPFYIMPVAVGILYFVQMSLTPQTTMDPAQQKMMKFIPLVFCVFMINIPSGLILYFFINTIFGIGQQFILHKEKSNAAA